MLLEVSSYNYAQFAFSSGKDSSLTTALGVEARMLERGEVGTQELEKLVPFCVYICAYSSERCLTMVVIYILLCFVLSFFVFVRLVLLFFRTYIV
jgi:hypothetical protein